MKKFLNIDKYNTPSKLLYYFLNEYGNNKLYTRDKINTCELVNAFIRSTWSLIWCWSWVFVGLFMIMLAMIGTIMVFKFGFVALNQLELMSVSTIIFWLIPIVCGVTFLFVVIDNYLTGLRYAKKEVIKLPKQKTIFGTWVESIQNKVCIDIDLKDFR